MLFFELVAALQIHNKTFEEKSRNYFGLYFLKGKTM